VAGLVVITPAAGFVGPMSAVVMGLLAGVICFGGVMLKSKFGYDDALDAFGVHGVGGAAGAVLTGVFAQQLWNPAGKDGLLFGGTEAFVEQLIAVGAAGAYAVVVTIGILKVVDALVGLRADEESEREGLDMAMHGETAYHTGGMQAHGAAGEVELVEHRGSTAAAVAHG
jgi:Amt family ammonium transporter